VTTSNDNTRFFHSLTSTLRAVSNNSELLITHSEQDALLDGHIYIPLINQPIDTRLQTALRGMVDSYAFMYVYHDREIHSRLAPKETKAERLFSLLERERFEARGKRMYKGCADNLTQMWLRNHTSELINRFNGAEMLELMLSVMCRESLVGESLPQWLMHEIDLHREPIEKLVGNQLCELTNNVADQTAYAKTALDIIQALGFDVEPAAIEPGQSDSTQSNSEELDGEAQSEDDGDVENDQEGDPYENAELHKDEQSNESLEDAAITRNADADLSKEEVEEPEGADIKNSTTQNAQEITEVVYKKADYFAYSDHADEIVTPAQLRTPAELKQLRKKLNDSLARQERLVNKLASRLQNVLLARQKRRWQYDLDEGELDTRRLSRVVSEPLTPLTYRIETDTEFRDTAITLLIDNSRSMFGSPIKVAAACSDLLTRSLEKCGVTTEVLGYTTQTMYGGENLERWKESGSMANSGRLNSLRHIIYKSAHHTWRQARLNFGLMLDKDILKQNIDGEALSWAHSRLLARPESRKILIVISDGTPSDSPTLRANHKAYLTDHLRSVIASIRHGSAVELIAIGIGYDVTRFYDRAITIGDVDELGPALLNTLTNSFEKRIQSRTQPSGMAQQM